MRPLNRVSERLPGTAIWTHQLSVASEPAGKVIDFVDCDLACLVRRFSLTNPLQFRMALKGPVTVVWNEANLAGCDGAVLLEVPAGRYFNHVYPFPTVVYQQIAWRGPLQTAVLDDTNLVFTINPGTTDLFISGGPDYPQAINTIEAALAAPFEELSDRTHNSWRKFSRSGRDFGSILPQTLPLRQQLLQTCDDVAVMIKAQQSREGGILAGYNYHMAYVRDQYGTARGLLALGQVAEARAILAFYWQVWQRYGAIHNGQGAGLEGFFHIHENDEVELTGYLIQQAFDLLEHTGDHDFIAQIFPMLEWAWQSQLKHLVNGMLPFNGDETYIAGGMLPRSAINDGSSEATLLLLSGGQKLVEWVEKNRRWPADAVAHARRVLASTRAAFKDNFFINGSLVANNPARAASASLPRFRHGVCEKCQSDPARWFIVWTERNASGRYLCPKCLAEGPFPAAEPTAFNLQSTALVPFYLKTDILTGADLAPAVDAILKRSQANDQLSTQLDRHNRETYSYAVGYDFGFLLNALTALRHPQAVEIYRQTMAVCDQTGAWVEYYLDNHPMGTRCRPWESAINLEAVLNWALK